MNKKERKRETTKKKKTRETNLLIIGRTRECFELFLRSFFSFLLLLFFSQKLTKPIRICRKKRPKENEGIGSTSLIFLSMGQS